MVRKNNMHFLCPCIVFSSSKTSFACSAIWSKTSLYSSDLIIVCNYLQGQLLTFLHMGGLWLYSMPRLCVTSFVRGELFACEQCTMLIHSKTDLLSPSQLLVPLLSIPRLPIQQLAPHWEFAGASSRMTPSSATSCAINQWAPRGTVMNKQVGRPGPRGHCSSQWQNQLVPKCLDLLQQAVPNLSYRPPCFLLLALSLFPCQVCQAVVAVEPITGAQTGWGSNWESGKGTVDGVRSQQQHFLSCGWALC